MGCEEEGGARWLELTLYSFFFSFVSLSSFGFYNLSIIKAYIEFTHLDRKK